MTDLQKDQKDQKDQKKDQKDQKDQKKKQLYYPLTDNTINLPPIILTSSLFTYDNVTNKITYNNKNIREFEIATKKQIIDKKRFNNEEFAIMTTRVSNDTLLETNKWCKEQQLQNIKTVYACSVAISKHVKQHKLLVIEMNNTTNKILGIGYIQNILPESFKYQIFSSNRTVNNKYAYMCRRRIDISDMTTNELELIRLLEIFCFKGKCNMKRVRGITRFSLRLQSKLIQNEGLNIYEEIKKIFTNRL